MHHTPNHWTNAAPPKTLSRKAAARVDREMSEGIKRDAKECKERLAKIASGEIPHPLDGLSDEFRSAAHRHRENWNLKPGQTVQQVEEDIDHGAADFKRRRGI